MKEELQSSCSFHDQAVFLKLGIGCLHCKWEATVCFNSKPHFAWTHDLSSSAVSVSSDLNEALNRGDKSQHGKAWSMPMEAVEHWDKSIWWFSAAGETAPEIYVIIKLSCAVAPWISSTVTKPSTPEDSLLFIEHSFPPKVDNGTGQRRSQLRTLPLILVCSLWQLQAIISLFTNCYAL